MRSAAAVVTTDYGNRGDRLYGGTGASTGSRRLRQRLVVFDDSTATRGLRPATAAISLPVPGAGNRFNRCEICGAMHQQPGEGQVFQGAPALRASGNSRRDPRWASRARLKTLEENQAHCVPGLVEVLRTEVEG